jgi:hypothetical protein
LTTVGTLRRKQEELRALLETGVPERRLQEFLEQHTEFIPRQFVQHHGVANSLAISQLAFGRDLVSDFVLVSGSSDDWWIILVELELPSAQFFKNNHGAGQIKLNAAFQRGLDQISSWRAWLNNQANLNHLYEHELLPLVASHLHRKVLVKYVLVTGRRSMYEGSRQKQDLILAQERDDFAIMTWDSLVDHPKTHDPLYIGRRRDGFIDIMTQRFLTDDLFHWIEPHGIRLNRNLRAEAEQFVGPMRLPKTFTDYRIDPEKFAKMGTWN